MMHTKDVFRGSERTSLVNVPDLLATIRENREKHIQEYKEAVEGYVFEARKTLVSQHEKALKKIATAYDLASRSLDKYDPEKADDTIVLCNSISFNLVAPRCYVDAYDQAIEMLEWDQRDQIELTAKEFRCFVMDRWDWMDDFRNVAISYTSNR